MKFRICLAIIGSFLGWLIAMTYLEYEKEVRIQAMQERSIINLQAEVQALKWELKEIWKELKEK